MRRIATFFAATALAVTAFAPAAFAGNAVGKDCGFGTTHSGLAKAGAEAKNPGDGGSVFEYTIHKSVLGFDNPGQHKGASGLC